MRFVFVWVFFAPVKQVGTRRLAKYWVVGAKTGIKQRALNSFTKINKNLEEHTLKKILEHRTLSCCLHLDQLLNHRWDSVWSVDCNIWTFLKFLIIPYCGKHHELPPVFHFVSFILLVDVYPLTKIMSAKPCLVDVIGGRTISHSSASSKYYRSAGSKPVFCCQMRKSNTVDLLGFEHCREDWIEVLTAPLFLVGKKYWGTHENSTQLFKNVYLV